MSGVPVDGASGEQCLFFSLVCCMDKMFATGFALPGVKLDSFDGALSALSCGDVGLAEGNKNCVPSPSIMCLPK